MEFNALTTDGARIDAQPFAAGATALTGRGLSSNVSRLIEIVLMNSYDPSIDPDPNSWLQADESQRISFIEAFHRAEGIELPNETAHAAIHAIVENQIALGVSAVVEAMARLQGEGLERHEAVHAVGTVLAEVLHSLMRSNGSPDPDSSNAKYEKALKKLTVAWWHRNYG